LEKRRKKGDGFLLKLEKVVKFLGLMEVEKWIGGVGEGMSCLVDTLKKTRFLLA